eukprot:SM000097S24761  [mRNA]  locus=s97:152586:160145:+ [translate_table: standard]
MDLATLGGVLQLALSPSPQERKAAEDKLIEFQHAPGHLVRLMQVIVSTSADLAIRQIASIYFKNLVAKDWVAKDSGRASKDGTCDKATVRDNLLEAIICAPALLRSQLGECLKTIVQSDYPEQWQALLPLVDGNLHSMDQPRVTGALFALRVLARKYEFKHEDEERAPSHVLVSTTFPVLINIFKYLLSLPEPDAEIAILIKLICKIFWSSCYVRTSAPIPHQLSWRCQSLCRRRMFALPGWVASSISLSDLSQRQAAVMGSLLGGRSRSGRCTSSTASTNGKQPELSFCDNTNLSLPPYTLLLLVPTVEVAWSVDVKDTDSKSWACSCSFGDPKVVKGEPRAFAVMFQKRFAGKFLQAYLALLLRIRQEGGHQPERVINLALQYLTTSISKTPQYQLLKPQLNVVLFEICFPLMCFNDSDAALWRDDPHEYVRKGYDIIEDMYSPRTGAINLIVELVRKRGKENLQPLLTSIVDVFNNFKNSPPEARQYQQKDGALLVVGALSDKLKATEPYKNQLETMLVHHVFPEFQSPMGHLRAKAAWVAGQYADIPYAETSHFTHAFHSVVAALRDSELPVRVDSVVALRSFVECIQASHKIDNRAELDEMRAMLPQLLDELFKLMNEVENDDLVFTLETIVDKFGEEMAPYALGLVQNLVVPFVIAKHIMQPYATDAAAFWKCVKSSDADEDDDDGLLAAVGCLRAIGTILESISALPHLFPQLEPTLLPIMQQMLSEDGQDVFEEVLEIASYMTYFTPTITLDMWSIWPLMVKAVNSWAVDFFDNVLGPMDNLISRSTEHFLTCQEPNYQQDLYNMVATLLGDEKLEDEDVEAAPKLMESVLQNCQGRVDHWVEPYLTIAIKRLRVAKKLHVKDLLTETLANALYYNAPLCISILQKMGVTGEVFQTWFQMLYARHKNGRPMHFRREHDKKVCILGLARLLLVPVAVLPEELQSGLDQVFKGLLKLLVEYKEQQAGVTQAAKAEEEEEEDEEAEDLEEGWEDEEIEDGDEDDENEDANGDNERVQRVAQKAGASFQWASENDEDDSDDEDWIDEEEFQSPIDAIDPFVYFADTMKTMSATDPQRFQMLTGGLDFQHQAMAHGLAQHAEDRRQEIEKEKAEELLKAQKQ